jgi:hypothetical protein
MKKIIAFVLSIMVLLRPICASAYSVLPIAYWYSNSSDIGFWASTPTISRIKLNTNSTFYFEDGYSRARSQWSGAGISTTSIGSSTSAQIVCRGGTVNEIVNAGTGITASTLNGLNGITYISSTFQDYLSYNGSQKVLRKLSSADVYIVDNGNTLNEQKNTFIHEVGHALGWFGHSTVSSDVMYTYGTCIITLTTRDKDHLTQVY